MNFIKDIYGFLWDVLLIFPSFLRAAFYLVLCWLLVRLLLPVIKKLLALLFNLFLLINTGVSNLIDRFAGRDYPLLDGPIERAIQTLSQNDSAARFLRRGKKVCNIMLIVLLVIAEAAYLPIFEQTRLNEYTNNVRTAFANFENGATAGLGIDAKPVFQPKEKTQKQFFYLNEKGKDGARINKMPWIDDSQEPVDVVSGKDAVEYMGKKEKDDREVQWFYVKSPEGKIGWISGNLIQ